MININKIAKEITAMQFNYYNQQNIIILSNNENGYIQYFIQKNNNKYNVLKIKDLNEIKKEFNQYSLESLNEFLFGLNYDDLIKYKQQFVEKQYIFNCQELQEYFVTSNNIKMNPIQFYKIFQLKTSCFQFTTINNIDIYIEKKYDKDIVDKCIKKLLSINKNSIFKNICLIFTNKIVQRDGHDIGGNYIKNIHDYDAQFTIGKINPFFDLFHQLGHYIAQNLFTNKDLKQIFNYVKYSQIFNFKDDYYKTNQYECFSELIAHYYNDQFNNQAKKFVQEKILSKI